MDRKLLDCFSNLSKALEALASALQESKGSKEASGSSVEDSLKGLDIVAQLKSIDEGVKKISSENKEIIKNQKSILTAVSKQETKKSSEFEQMSQAFDKNQQSGVKDGVKMILLIAGGILAIGLAFKLVGSVDIKTVLAISLALPLIAFAFEKVSKIKATLREIGMASLALVVMAATIALSSMILGLVKPITAGQLLTTVLIAGAFAALAFNLDKLANGIKGVDPKNLYKMPLVLLAASVAIALSSYVLQFVKPVGFLQLITIVFIAATFAVISYGIGKIAKAIEGIKNVALTTILMPLVLVALSVAIAASSQLLSQVVPIEFGQAMTSIMIAAVFVVASYGLPKIAEAISKVPIAGALLMPIILVAMSYAIAQSSIILSQVKEIKFTTLFNIAMQAVALTIIGISFAAIIFAFDKLGVNPVKAFMAGLSLVIISGAIYASSLLISQGNYTNSPSLDWTIGTSLAMFAFGALAATGGPLLSEIALGAIGLLIIATTVMASSHLLALGNYQVYPDLSWSLGVGASMLALGVAMMAIGAITLVTGGLGLAALGIGAAGILIIAATIVQASSILSGGVFTGGPSFDWAAGTGILLVAFGTSMLLLGTFITATLGGGYLMLKLGASAINLVAQSIVDSAAILSKGTYTGGPSESWARGVGLSIAAFAPVFSMLSSGGIFGIFSGLKTSDITDTIRSISQAIVDAAIFFNNNSVAFEGGPSKEWSEGVGLAISAFGPTIGLLNKGGLFSLFTGGLTVDGMTETITGICKAIVTAGSILKDGIFTGGPTKEWSEGVGTAISSFSPLIDNLNKGGIFSIFKGGLSTGDMMSVILGISFAIKESSVILSQGNYNVIPNDYITNLSSNIKEVVKLTQYLNGMGLGGTFLGIRVGSSQISRMATDYEKLSKSLTNLSNSIQSLDIEKLTALKTFTGSIVLMSLMDSGQFEEMMNKLEDKAKVFVSVMNELGEATSGTEIKIGATSEKEGPSIKDVLTMMARIDQRLGQISTYNSKMSSYVDELRSSGSRTLKNRK
jgi:hypothetical protein